jgi:uncharacterized protein
MNEIIILLLGGLLAGVFSGLIGIGGGTIMVPILVYMLGYGQHEAQGTTLFMFLFPIGILGVMNYYQQGYIDWKAAAIMACTFFIGSFFGSKFAISLDKVTLQRIFGGVMLLLSLKMILGK